MGYAIRKEDMYDQGWRLNNLYKIKTKAGRVEPFRMNWAQQQMFEGMWYNNLVLKVRQIGSTTFWCLFGLDSAVFNPAYSVGINAHEREAAEDIFDRNIKFPYENLPESVRQTVPDSRDNIRQLKFSNDSMVVVGTSLRGGTYQLAIITEFGKTCAKFPAKAKEIVTGTLEAVGQGNVTVIESTAEGNEGYFYEYCQAAKALQDAGKKLTKADYRLHFLPWMHEPAYQLSGADTQATVIDASDNEYFDKIQDETGVSITPNQRAWYVKKKERLGPDVKREYPSTPGEAFEQSTEGTYYGHQIAVIRQRGQIGKLPIEPSVPINTYWDLGIDDFTAIWLHQHVGNRHHFVRYIENNGEPLQYYVNLLWEYKQQGYVFGKHYMPHDAANRRMNIGDTKSIEQHAVDLGLMPIAIINTNDLLAGIMETRNKLLTSWFDEEGCRRGIRRLENYRKEWNDRLATYHSRPRHDDNSHGADAMRIFAQGYRPLSGLDSDDYIPDAVNEY
jgi:hypothetical protein